MLLLFLVLLMSVLRGKFFDANGCEGAEGGTVGSALVSDACKDVKRGTVCDLCDDSEGDAVQRQHGEVRVDSPRGWETELLTALMDRAALPVHRVQQHVSAHTWLCTHTHRQSHAHKETHVVHQTR